MWGVYSLLWYTVSIVFVYTQLNVKTVLIQTIQFSISIVSTSKTVLFQVIQFNIRTQISSIGPIDRTLLGATTLSQSGAGSNGNKGIVCIPQSSSITGTSPSDCLVSYQDTRWGWGLTLCREAVSVFYSPSRLVNWLIDRTLSGATTPSLSGPGSNDNEGVLHIPPNCNTGGLPSDGLMSYPGQSLQESYPSAEMLTVYSTAPTNWAAKLFLVKDYTIKTDIFRGYLSSNSIVLKLHDHE